MKLGELRTWARSYSVFKKMGGRDFSGYRIITSASRGLSELEKELMPVYTNYFSPEIEKYKSMPFVQEESSDMPIWVCWWQGLENMPDVVANCFERLKHVYSDRKIVFICKDNYRSYVSISENILDLLDNGTLSVTFFSDYLRSCLLYEYGGLWMDSSVYCVRRFGSNRSFITAKPYCLNMKMEELVPSGLWTIFFMGSEFRKCSVFGFLRDSLEKMYCNYRCNPYYFSTDMILRLAYVHFPEFKKEIDSIPSNNCDIHHFASCWNDGFDSDDFTSLCKKNDVFKLNAKWNVDENKKNTWHDFFCSDKALDWPCEMV